MVQGPLCLSLAGCQDRKSPVVKHQHPVDRGMDWDSGDLASNAGSVAELLCESGRVDAFPTLCLCYLFIL